MQELGMVCEGSSTGMRVCGVSGEGLHLNCNNEMLFQKQPWV